jgi:hypothetical protein
MSKEFVQLFFPALSSLLSSPDSSPSLLVDAWNKIFPDDVSKLCRLPSSSSSSSPPINGINRYTLHRPCLAISAMIGIMIGLQPHHLSKSVPVQHRSGEGFTTELVDSIHDAWSKSRTAFGVMNLVAMILHCILPSFKQESHTIVMIGNFFWAADCIFTGISCIHLIHVAMLMYSLDENSKCSITDVTILNCSRKRASKIIHGSMLVSVASLSLVCQLRQTGYFDPLITACTFIEMLYIIPLISAISFLFPAAFCRAFTIHRACNKNSILGSRIAILGGIVAVASVAFDSSLCYIISAHLPRIKTTHLLYDIYHLPTLVFLGCDISFWGLGIWIDGLISFLSESNKKLI